jgi:hypothetical protein
MKRLAGLVLLFVPLVAPVAACPMESSVGVPVRCEPAVIHLGWIVRHCTTELRDGYAVIATRPAEGVSSLPNPPMITIATDFGPFASPKGAFQQWADGHITAASNDQRRYLAALENAPIWDRQVGRQYFQLLLNTPQKCPFQNCVGLMNSTWNLPVAQALCAAVGDFKPTP